MKIIALLALLTISGCAHLTPAASCVADPALVPEVVADLTGADYEMRLLALARQVGLCVVDATVVSLLTPPDAGARLTATSFEQRARAWLAAHPVTH